MSYDLRMGGAKSPMNQIDRKSSGNLTQQLVVYLTQLVESGALAPGEKLPPESEIVRTQGVSRTVVREAVSKLQAAGLIETRHGVGSFVLDAGQRPNLEAIIGSATKVRDVISILELRIALETEAAGLAAVRRTDAQLAEMRDSLDRFRDKLAKGEETVEPDFEFHLGIARATANPYFAELLGHLGASVIPRSRLPTTFNKDASYFDRISHEHDDILNAIERRDPEGARAAVKNHLVNSRERMRRIYAIAEADVNTNGVASR
jgi:GntR family transcriptional repressor for pyruvate dehydrogenase complex